MAEVGFYHLRNLTLERMLPKLLERALVDGYRIQVMAGAQERVDHLDTLLWTYADDSFLPHGTRRSGEAARQPIWITSDDENANGANLLVLVDGARSAHLGSYKRICDVFDGNDEAALAAARQRWKAAKDAGHTLTYWEETPRGWEKH
ncbi:MAG TPA: DNA polymerase III subunit chi [Stellaceae bacterium]|nr:DNA polymerase III subunit chi [Stellaceae bacterium]